ncbi:MULTISPECIES: transglycosylase domain-containing protein [unclassified Granulicatella]|uniref:transglycosylase domain-containing protein n=1 Tax=unclassified Granulicatella TaxID=2630493 RepID=UPI0010744ECD|nr:MULTISPECIES: PBP1A family penicillin-binding protein [unclassified Granulicatella]MBF0780048.1 PBP1A family penicillin-binding protein [Granulicatella sp. 19428wC4_WM01]TFU95898.1 PBP1A family penicillin-binding protein [Granulicatella sp. WM01]
MTSRMDRHQKQSVIKQIRGRVKQYHLVKWIVFLTLMGCIIFSSYLLYLAKTTDIKALKVSLEQKTILYDANGEQAGELLQQKGTFVPLGEISPHIVDAVISTEDRRFYTHSGVDYLGIARSSLGFFVNGFKVSGGGSTITQQLAKNAYLTQKQTFIRKAQEVFLALEIERQYSKDDILTMYLNHAYFGQGVWGVEDASKKYFGKSAKELSVPEAAVIAGMLKSPTYYNPIDYPKEAKDRRDTVIELMKTNGKISADEATMYMQTDIVLQDKYDVMSNYQYPYFFDSVIDEAEKKYGITEEDLLTKGYKIYTTLNQNYQKQLNQAYDNQELFQNAQDGTLVQSATVMMHPKTGGVLALVGGRGEHVYRGFNRATQMYRQPGSTIKPLVVYTPALEQGYTPDSILVDEELSYGSDHYTPKNWNYVSIGKIPLYQALVESKNTSAVWLLDKIGLQTGLDKLHDFGIETQKDDHYLGIALGGMTKGVTLMHMTSAYTAFANNGVRQEPYFITKIIDASGNAIVDKTYNHTYRVMSDGIANEMTRIMLGVYEQDGTGYVPLNHSDYQIAGKTGTTEVPGQTGAQDKWIIAYTPDFVYTTWMGFDETSQNTKLESAYSQIQPFFQTTINDVLAVSPLTSFQLKSVTTQKQEEKANRNWFEKATDKLESFGRDIGDGIGNLWNGITNFFNGR